MLLRSNIPFKYIIGKIWPGMVFVSIYSIIVAALYNNFHFTRISIPLSVPMILGTVISLLLGFRSNQAYDRWWEARIIWGAIVNDSRTISRQMLTFTGGAFQDEELQQFRQRFIRRQMAWSIALSKSLRKEKVLPAIKSYLVEEEMQFISRYSNIPAAMLELHGRDISYALEMGWINQFQQVALDESLTRLCDSMGKCERIKNTVFPATYSLYIHFAMNLFIMMLPFSLIEYFGFVEIPMVMAIAASFMLIEKMAIHLQDPFENKPTDTPMTAISRTIERDLKQMLNDYKIVEPEAEVNKHYYVL